MQALDFKLSIVVEEIIHIAKSVAKENYNTSYNAAHLLKALLHKSIGLHSFFDQIDGDIYYYEEWAEVRIESLPTSHVIPDEIEGDKSVASVFNEASSIQLKLGEDEISSLALLASLCTPGVGFSYEQLKSFPLKSEDVLLAIQQNSNTNQVTPVTNGAIVPNSKVDLGVLSSFCIDKTKLAKNGELPLIFGRDAAIKMVLEILGRHAKPNVLITGEPGVGKTAFLNGFTEAIANGNVPESMKNAQVYELDFINLVSGASYKSEVEDRFKKIIIALKAFEKPILLIDEINNITDKTSGNQGLVNIVRAELVKGEITFVATATNDAYRKHVEIDEGLVRRFEKIQLEEPTEEEALQMISNTIDRYKKHHKLNILDETISEAIRLSKRFNKDRSLPDSAIDLIDRTMSAVCYMVETTKSQVEDLIQKLNTILVETTDEIVQKKKIQWIFDNLKNKFSYLLFTSLGEEALNLKSINTSQEYAEGIKDILNQFLEKVAIPQTEVDKNDISATIANKTGIPVGKLQSDEKERLLQIEDHLKKRVIGQDHAIATISAAILESRSGLSTPGLPIGSFFFTGPTGTGKTELAKSLAEFLFQTEDAIIRFDMSEFKEEHSAALLYGAPPGYVGYEEGGILVNKIRQKPYSIVLFDEIEKAHPSVFDIFLQILDEGKLHDRLGKMGDFSNAVVLFTSNIGSEQVVQTFEKGEIPASSEILEYMGNYFRPEFLGRLTEIVPFAPITKENIVNIFLIQLKDLHNALQKQDITLSVSDAATEYLAYKGFTPKYGARPLRRIIRTELRGPLSKMLITGKVSKGANIILDIKNEQLVWSFE